MRHGLGQIPSNARVDMPVYCSCRSIMPYESVQMTKGRVRNKRSRQMPEEYAKSREGGGKILQTAVQSLPISILFLNNVIHLHFQILDALCKFNLSMLFGALVALRGVIHPRTPTVSVFASSHSPLPPSFPHHLHSTNRLVQPTDPCATRRIATVSFHSRNCLLAAWQQTHTHSHHTYLLAPGQLQHTLPLRLLGELCNW